VVCTLTNRSLHPAPLALPTMRIPHCGTGDARFRGFCRRSSKELRQSRLVRRLAFLRDTHWLGILRTQMGITFVAPLSHDTGSWMMRFTHAALNYIRESRRDS
jgi:hypothetical protein